MSNSPAPPPPFLTREVFEHPIVLGVGFALILFLLAPLITDWPAAILLALVALIVGVALIGRWVFVRTRRARFQLQRIDDLQHQVAFLAEKMRTLGGRSEALEVELRARVSELEERVSNTEIRPSGKRPRSQAPITRDLTDRQW